MLDICLTKFVTARKLSDGYSPNVGEEEFCEVRKAPVQHLWVYGAQIVCLRVLSSLPHNTFRMCST
jgi:hypothetical protein